MKTINRRACIPFKRMWPVFLVAFALMSPSVALTASPDNAAVSSRHNLSIEDVERLQRYRNLKNEALIEMSTATVRRILWKLDNPRPDGPLDAAQYRQTQQTGGPGLPIAENAVADAYARIAAIRNRTPVRNTPPTSSTSPSVELASQPAGTYAIGGVPTGPMTLPAAVPESSINVPVDPNSGILRLEVEPLPPSRLQGGSVTAPLPESAGLSRAAWKWLGPGNIGGRTRSIIVHPSNPRIMWVAAVAGGIWKTTDGGQSWGPLADFMTSLNVSTLVIHPSNPDVLYAGTGEGFYNIDAFQGAGVFRSTNGGATWQQIPATKGYLFVNRLAVSADGAAFLVATRNGLYRSTNFSNGDLSAIVFERVTSLTGRDLLYVGCSRSTPTICMAGGRGRSAYYSEDLGRTWSAASGLTSDPSETFAGRVEIAFAAANANTVYASVDNALGEVYRSVDGGKTFTLRNTGSQFLSKQGWYNNTIWAGDPRNAEVVLVGGLDLHRSSDGGATFVPISEWWRAPRSAHADHHAIVAHPQYDGVNNRTVYFGNDGGVYRNDDVLTAAPTTGWTVLNNNYGATQFYGAAGNALSGRVVGGAQDNGTLLYRAPPGINTGPNGYTSMFGGDGGFSAADPTNPNFMYGEYTYLQIHRSINGGEGANYIYAGITDVGDSAKSLFVAPFILDPGDPNIMLAGGSSLWRSTNVKAATPAWQQIKSVATGSPKISAVETRRSGSSASGVIWVGHTDGQLFRSFNGTAALPTWTTVASGGSTSLPRRYVSRIRVDAANTRRVFVAFAGFQTNNVWRSDDQGVNWISVGTDLPPASVYDIAIHPRNPNVLYAATEVGLFASEDAGKTWWPTNQGPANVTVQELFWLEQVLVAVTHGRGIFWIDLSAVQPAAGVAEPESAAQPIPRPQFVPTAVVPTDPVNSR